MDIFLLVSSFLKHKFSFHGKQQMEKKKNRTSREQHKYLILQLNYRTTTVMQPSHSAGHV